MNNVKEKVKSCQRLKGCFLAFMILAIVQLVYIVASFLINTEGYTKAEQELATNIFYIVNISLESLKIAIFIWFAVEYFIARKVTKGLLVAFYLSLSAIVFSLASLLLSIFVSINYLPQILTFLALICYFTAFEFHINTMVEIDRAMRYRINFVMGMVLLSIFCTLLLLINMSTTLKLIIFIIVYLAIIVANISEVVILNKAKAILKSQDVGEEN